VRILLFPCRLVDIGSNLRVIWLKWALHRRRIEFGLRRQLHIVGRPGLVWFELRSDNQRTLTLANFKLTHLFQQGHEVVRMFFLDGKNAFHHAS
jgi:hypothetical protein